MQHRIQDTMVAGLNVLISNARHDSFMFTLDYIDTARLRGLENFVGVNMCQGAKFDVKVGEL